MFIDKNVNLLNEKYLCQIEEALPTVALTHIVIVVVVYINIFEIAKTAQIL